MPGFTNDHPQQRALDLVRDLIRLTDFLRSTFQPLWEEDRAVYEASNLESEEPTHHREVTPRLRTHEAEFYSEMELRAGHNYVENQPMARQLAPGLPACFQRHWSRRVNERRPRNVEDNGQRETDDEDCRESDLPRRRASGPGHRRREDRRPPRFG